MKIGSALGQTTLLGQKVQTAHVFRGQMALDAKAVDAFAEELTRRSEQGATPAQAQTTDAKGLTRAMTGAVDWVKDTLGSDAARAVMGIVMGSAGDGPLSEDTLGQGFVNALQFLDNTFGTKVGDQAIGVFNGQLNNALNGYFQNGHDESFLAADLDTAKSQAGKAMADTVAQFFKNTQGGTADAGSSLMDQMDKDRRKTEAEDQARLEAKTQARTESEKQAQEDAQAAALEAARQNSAQTGSQAGIPSQNGGAGVAQAPSAQTQSGPASAAERAQAQAEAVRLQAQAAQATAQGDQAGAARASQAAQEALTKAQAQATGPVEGTDASAAGAAGQGAPLVQAGASGQASQTTAQPTEADVAQVQASRPAPTVSVSRVRRLSRSASLRGYAASALPTGVVVSATA